MIKFANRASAILYNYIITNPPLKPLLIPANVCPIVPMTLIKANVDFEFVDIDDSHAMNLNSVIDKIKTHKYSGIIFVHAYGKIIDTEKYYTNIKSIDPNLLIIDDKCLCRPKLNSKIENNIDLEIFSTGYAKYIELNYGGWGIINDKYNYKAQNIIFDGANELNTQMDYVKTCLNEEVKYQPTNANWLDGECSFQENHYTQIVKKEITRIDEHKKIINNIYKNNIPQEIQLGTDYNNWRFMVKAKNRMTIIENVFQQNLFVGTNFPSVSKLFKAVESPYAELEAKNILNLFNDFRINESDALKICKIIHKSL